jgi:hypothetical protein
MSKSTTSTFAFYASEMGVQPRRIISEVLLVAGCGSSFKKSWLKLQEVRL